MMAKLRVFARVKARDSKEQELRQILLELVKASRNEDGVDFYELFETTEGGEFIFNEQYASKEDYEAHILTDHLKAAFAASEHVRDGEVTAWFVDPVEPVL